MSNDYNLKTTPIKASAKQNKNLLIRALRLFRHANSVKHSPATVAENAFNSSEKLPYSNRGSRKGSVEKCSSSYKHPQYNITKRTSVEYVPMHISTFSSKNVEETGFNILSRLLGEDRYRIHTPSVDNPNEYYRSYQVRKKESIKASMNSPLHLKKSYFIRRSSDAPTKMSAEPIREPLTHHKIKANTKTPSRKYQTYIIQKTTPVVIKGRSTPYGLNRDTNRKGVTNTYQSNTALSTLNYDNLLPLLGRDYKKPLMIDSITGW
jgi:hypothetical protein